MKRIFNYLTISLLLFMTMTGCKDNSNWRILEETPVGTYIVGTGTVFSRAGSASQLSPVKLDVSGGVTSQNIVGIFTYLKSSGDFTISHSVVADALSNWGAGSVISSVEGRGTTYQLVDGASGFKVSSDGVYYVVVNTELAQLTIMPCNWGIIGDATPDGWNGQTSLGTPAYNDKQQEVIWTSKETMKEGEMKFRFSNNWGYEIDSTLTHKTKLYTDLTTETPLSSAFVDLSTGGPNISVSEAGDYQVTLKLSIQSGSYQAKMVKAE